MGRLTNNELQHDSWHISCAAGLICAVATLEMRAIILHICIFLLWLQIQNMNLSFKVPITSRSSCIISIISQEWYLPPRSCNICVRTGTGPSRCSVWTSIWLYAPRHLYVLVTFSPLEFPWGSCYLLLIFLPWEKWGHWLTEERCDGSLWDPHWLTLTSPHCCHWKQLKIAKVGNT